MFCRHQWKEFKWIERGGVHPNANEYYEIWKQCSKCGKERYLGTEKVVDHSNIVPV